MIFDYIHVDNRNESDNESDNFMSNNYDWLDDVLNKSNEPIDEPDNDDDYEKSLVTEDSEGNIYDYRGKKIVSGKKDITIKKKTVVTVKESPKITTTTTIETITSSGLGLPKKERILPEGQKDLEGNDVSNISFGELVSRNVMKATYKILENYLVLFPRYDFKNEISGMILYGPNGTGKTEFCNFIMIRQEFVKYCDFEKVDIYDLIDNKMGKTSEKVAYKFKEWINIYKKKNRIQVKIIDEGEMVFLQKKDRGSKAYSELSNSMLKHTGKFNGIFIILITNDLEYLNKGAISRFEKIYWPLLDDLERTDFMKYKLEKSEIKVDMKDFDKITPYLGCLHFGDIRTHNKLMSYIKGWYVRNHKQGDMISITELIPIFIEFNNEMKKENEEIEKKENINKSYSDEDIEDMIDYLIKYSDKKHVNEYVKLKEDYKQFGLRGNQLQGYVLPAYETMMKQNKLKIGDLKI